MSVIRPNDDADSGIRLAYLGIAVIIMLSGTIDPLMMINTSGTVDHRLVMALLWAMSAGFVRGVGFVPHALILRWLFSGWACLGCTGLAVLFKFMQ